MLKKDILVNEEFLASLTQAEREYENVLQYILVIISFVQVGILEEVHLPNNWEAHIGGYTE